MKITIDKQDFYRVVNEAQKITASKKILPILSNFLLETVNDRIRLSSTDLDNSFISYVAGVIDDHGAVLVPAKVLTQIVKEMPNGDITISLVKNKSGNKLNVSSGTVKINYTLNILDAEDYPALPDVSQVETSQIEVSVLKVLLNKVLYSAAKEDTNIATNSVYIEQDQSNKLRFVTTDGSRLSLAEIAVEEPFIKNGSKILPLRAAQTLQSWLNSCETEGTVGFGFLNDNFIVFTSGDDLLVLREINAQYPDYRVVIPDPERVKFVFSFSREDLLDCLKRASMMVSQTDKGVFLKVDVTEGKAVMVLSVNNPNLGSSKETMELSKGEYLPDTSEQESNEGLPSSFDVRMNHKFLMEALNALDGIDYVNGYFIDGTSPFLLSDGDFFEQDNSFLGIIMPMRVNAQ